MIDAHEREVLEAKLVEQALSIEELTNSLRTVEGAHDGMGGGCRRCSAACTSHRAGGQAASAAQGGAGIAA